MRIISTSLLLASLALLAGCGPTSSASNRAGEEAAKRNQMDPQVEADWDNLVNESRPAMSFVSNTLNEVRELERNAAAADATNKQGGK